jgi:hypothetical protein
MCHGKKFNVEDVVKLKSGGAEMTVSEYVGDDDYRISKHLVETKEKFVDVIGLVVLSMMRIIDYVLMYFMRNNCRKLNDVCWHYQSHFYSTSYLCKYIQN